MDLYGGKIISAPILMKLGIVIPEGAITSQEKRTYSVYESVNGGSSVQNSVDFRCQWIFYRKLHVLHDTIAVAFNNRFYSHLTFQIREYVPLHISINFGSQNDSF